MKTIKVLINGAKGNMGKEAVLAVDGAQDLDLVSQIDIGDNLVEAIASSKADVVLDFTHPSCVANNVRTILEQNVPAVVGTTGLTDEEISEFKTTAEKKSLGVLIIPNFSIGAVLMMTFAAQAAKYLPRVEIIEMHHDKKADAPSGTAIKTAQMISEKHKVNDLDLEEKELISGARGGECEGIPIHSIRLPGYVASQEVILGGQGQTLSLRHDTRSRECFMPGVLLALREAPSTKGLIYGLEHLL